MNINKFELFFSIFVNENTNSYFFIIQMFALRKDSKNGINATIAGWVCIDKFESFCTNQLQNENYR